MPPEASSAFDFCFSTAVHDIASGNIGEPAFRAFCSAHGRGQGLRRARVSDSHMLGPEMQN